MFWEVLFGALGALFLFRWISGKLDRRNLERAARAEYEIHRIEELDKLYEQYIAEGMSGSEARAQVADVEAQLRIMETLKGIRA